MLNQKQFGYLKFLSVKHNWKFKIFFCLQSKNFPPDKRHPGHRSRYGKYGPRSGYGFLRTACQPIRIENFEKPYNNICYCAKNDSKLPPHDIRKLSSSFSAFGNTFCPNEPYSVTPSMLFNRNRV
jgi:hypothetical protein